MNDGDRDGRLHRLVNSAKRSFATRGFHATSVSLIVQEAGIARGTFYLHFDNKLHLFQSLLDSSLQNLTDQIRPISLEPGDPHPLEQIHDNLARVLDLVLDDRDLSAILLNQTSSMSESVEPRLYDFYQQVADMIESSLVLGISLDLVRPCDTRLMAYSLMGAVKEVVHQMIVARREETNVEETVQELLAFGLRAVLKDGQMSFLHERDRSRTAGVKAGR